MSRRKSQEQASPFDNLESILQRETSNQAKTKSRKRKREKASPTNVIFYKDQIRWLDGKCMQAREDNGMAVRRTALIRAIIDLAKSVDTDLSGVQSEDEILERLLRSFSNP